MWQVLILFKNQVSFYINPYIIVEVYLPFERVPNFVDALDSPVWVKNRNRVMINLFLAIYEEYLLYMKLESCYCYLHTFQDSSWISLHNICSCTNRRILVGLFSSNDTRCILLCRVDCWPFSRGCPLSSFLVDSPDSAGP